MLRQVKFRDRLVAMAIVPILIVAVVATGLLLFVDSGGTRPYAAFAFAALVVAGATAFFVGRSVLASVQELASATASLAELHRKLADGEATADEFEPIEAAGRDDLARLTTAINDVSTAALEASESQHGAVKAGLSNIVVNLARRSQTLLDRQVEFLDRLESTEEDPDRLSELFRVDHLATRMRRNAESLMVLAEADPGLRRGGPVDVADVLRVAMGEVENYQNIELQDVDEGQVEAGVAVDLAHLVAELMENASQFSPPNTSVDVSGTFDGAGRFRITVQDQGMGLTEERMAAANELLANPPELGLGMGRSLGFMVIGRLAQRLHAGVRLEPNEGGGTRAIVDIPAESVSGRSAGAPKSTATSGATRPAASKSEPDAETAAPETDAAGTPDHETVSDDTAAAEGGEDDPSWPTDSPESDRAAAPTAGSSTALDKLLGLNVAKLEPSSEERAAPVDWASASPFGDAAVDHDAGEVANDDAGEGAIDDADQDASDYAGVEPDQDAGDEHTTSDDGPAKLDDAVPSGEAFESGVASLLADPDASSGGEPAARSLRDNAATPAGLTKRQRGASHVPFGEGRQVGASGRNPEEVRSMLSRYRDGLNDGRQDSKERSEDGPEQSDETKDR